MSTLKFCVLSLALAFGAAIAGAAETPCWAVREWKGAPALFRNGKPTVPLMFWLREYQAQEVTNMVNAGIDFFSSFCSGAHYEHPYFSENGFNGMEYQRRNMDAILRDAPDAALMPRIFYTAPDWWISAHPAECVKYQNPNVLAPMPKLLGGSIPRESHASGLFRREFDPVFRQAVSFLCGRYGDRLPAIHLCAGHCGEHHPWEILTQVCQPHAFDISEMGFSDASKPMTDCFRRYLKETYGRDFPDAQVPTMAERLRTDVDGVWRDPEKSRRVVDYFRCIHRLMVDNLAHYARIVKEESGGRTTTLAFYGYTPDWNWTVECDHRDIYRALCLKDLDMLSAPHSYCRRKLGEDGLFRCFVDSNILHGKYFIDEGDDRTHLVYKDKKSDDPRVPRTPEDTDALLWRQFGQAVTHGVGLWYMDIIRYQYRDPAILKTIAEVRKVSERSLSYDRTHISQVALVTNPESEFYMAYRQTDGNRVSIVCYGDQIGEFCRAGAPFDWYIADDLGAVVERKYRVVVFVGCEYLTEKQAALVERLKSDGRALVFVHATGYVSESALSRPRMERICGQTMKPGTVRGLLFEKDSGRFFGAGEYQDGLFIPDGGETIACGFGELAKTPVVTRRAHDGWTSVFASIPRLDAAMLRRIYREAGVHVYTDADVVLSANRNWLMLHTNHAGDYDVRLPRTCRRVTDVTTGKTVATDADRFVHPMKKFRTAVFLMED